MSGVERSGADEAEDADEAVKRRTRTKRSGAEWSGVERSEAEWSGAKRSCAQSVHSFPPNPRTLSNLKNQPGINVTLDFQF